MYLTPSLPKVLLLLNNRNETVMNGGSNTEHIHRSNLPRMRTRKCVSMGVLSGCRPDVKLQAIPVRLIALTTKTETEVAVKP